MALKIPGQVFCGMFSVCICLRSSHDYSEVIGFCEDGHFGEKTFHFK